jgi:hypothetical protein
MSLKDATQVKYDFTMHVGITPTMYSHDNKRKLYTHTYTHNLYENMCLKQADKIGRIFVYWVTVFYG